LEVEMDTEISIAPERWRNTTIPDVTALEEMLE
jgi:hypothetical protein